LGNCRFKVVSHASVSHNVSTRISEH
jgi:hypothetical protein